MDILTNVALLCNRGLRVLEDPPLRLIYILKKGAVKPKKILIF